MLRIIPTGGVTVETAGAISSKRVARRWRRGRVSIAKEFLMNKDWAGLTARAEAFVEAVAKARAK